MLYCQNYFVFECKSYIMTYNLYSKEKIYFKVTSENYFIVPFPPHLFACIIGQFIYFYPDDALIDTKFIQKAKISKLNVVSLCSFNKGYFMGGYNRSPLPGGNLIDKRTIYYIEDISTDYKNKPQWEIPLPKSQNPVSHMQVQNPYLLCYCQPNLYVINPFDKTILLSFQKELLKMYLLEGRFATSCLNIVGVSQKEHIFSADVEKFPVYGVEINEFPFKATSLCQSKEGKIFSCFNNSIFTFDPFKRTQALFKAYEPNKIVMSIFCTPNNALVVLLKATEEKSEESLSPTSKETAIDKKDEEAQSESTYKPRSPSLIRKSSVQKEQGAGHFVEVFNISE